MDFAEGRLTARQVAQMLRLTERQAWWLLRRFRQDGAPGLVSRKRGRPSNRRHHPALHKQVNDKLGHAPGDELLRTVVKRRQNSLRSGDVSARLAGEEFAVLLRDSVSAWIVETISQRIIATISAPFRLERQEITIGTSIGIFMARDRMLTRDQIMQGADKALYQAKSEGRGRYRLFNTIPQPEQKVA
ncbi:hypothetical protein JH26_22095 [Microvirga sp. BSC39]|nr:hypothetical protein JH26_22095 [Microvirga sp. BSC39]